MASGPIETNNEKEEEQDDGSLSRTPLISAPARVREIIAGDGAGIKFKQHMLFIQMDVLTHFPEGQVGWKEMSRWLKYQESVETANRWSKPFLPTASMHSLTELKRLLSCGVCAVEFGSSQANLGPHFIAESLIGALKRNEHTHLTDQELDIVLETVLKPHKHINRKAASRHLDESQKKGRIREGEKEIANLYHNYPQGVTPDQLKPYKPNKHFRKKLPADCEGANILVGQLDFLKETAVVLCRFDQLSKMGDLTEIDVPTRFVFLILGPTSDTNIWALSEIGRAMGCLLNDKVFCEVAYRATSRQDLVDAIDEFVDELKVLPPSICDPDVRIDPPPQTRSMDKLLNRLDDVKRQKGVPFTHQQDEGASTDTSLMRTGRLFGGLINDMKHRYPLYLSDFKDAIHIQCLASILFLFFACITPIVTFGGLMGQKTDGFMGTIESLLSGAICGVTYAMFSGQPLTIIGATGPLLVFESILYYLCKENDIAFLPLRLWVGVWVVVALLIMVMFDLSTLVRYITRYTEESFSILISLIFIYEAMTKIYEIYEKYDVHTGVVREDPSVGCFCYPSEFKYLPFPNETDETSTINWMDYRVPSNWTESFRETCITLNNRVIVKSGCISEAACLQDGGNLTGSACYMESITNSVPDVFFLSIILFVGTYLLAMAFREFRTSPYFTTRIRSTVADFAVFMSVCAWTGIDYMFGINTPKLNVPVEFVNTRSDRTWLINPFDITYIWLIPLAIVPAILATILIFLDQQITAVIVNRKEHKLKKRHGYHLDLFVLAVLVGVCSFLGLPWFVAATVRSLTHVKSLVKISEVQIPGEKPQMIGTREQRVTGICIHILIGISVLITPVLRIIPMPVLYGVFLYMGLTSLGDVQFVERFTCMFMAQKLQPDHIYLRHVKASRVHTFTILQVFSFAAMWTVKSIKMTSIAFPVMLVVLMVVRKLMDFIFTQSELYWLDHLLPDAYRRAEEDRKKQLEEGLEKNGEVSATKTH